VQVCKEYLLGLLIESTRRDIGSGDPKRAVELACYFTHCQLQSVHLVFALKTAMIQAFKLRNFGTAKVLAERLLEQGPPAQFADSVFFNNIGKQNHCSR
jgi:coatomer protein complex subunit alpha (xenin)